MNINTANGTVVVLESAKIHKSNLAKTALYMLDSPIKLNMQAAYDFEGELCFGGFMMKLFQQKEVSVGAYKERIIGPDDSPLKESLFYADWESDKFKTAARALAILKDNTSEWDGDYTAEFYGELSLEELKEQLSSFVI